MPNRKKQAHPDQGGPTYMAVRLTADERNEIRNAAADWAKATGASSVNLSAFVRAAALEAARDRMRKGARHGKA